MQLKFTAPLMGTKWNGWWVQTGKYTMASKWIHIYPCKYFQHLGIIKGSALLKDRDMNQYTSLILMHQEEKNIINWYYEVKAFDTALRHLQAKLIIMLYSCLLSGFF